MSKVRVHSFATSLDGFCAGPDQDLEHPMGTGGGQLHQFMFATRYGKEMMGGTGGSEGIDDQILREGDAGVGATIMGRNMFGPIRGEWPDESWTGWWGPEPPYHHPVFVLTHHARPALEMEGTTFHFVTDGIESALEQATAAANGADVRIGGGTATVQAYLQAGLVDELNMVVVPALLGRGERLLAIDVVAAGYECTLVRRSDAATYYRLERRP